MEENEAFPLSEKYIDFLAYEASAEFLEGTTSARKINCSNTKVYV